METNQQPLERAQLKEFLVSHFSQDELERLAFDLGVDYGLLRCQNKENHSLELVTYFEHRDQLACLLDELFRRRPHHNLAHLSEGLSVCAPSSKIQIIAHTSAEATNEVEAFLELLTQKYNFNREEISLVAVAEGSLYLLLSLPDAVATILRRLANRPAAQAQSIFIEATPFTELPERSQKIWRMIAHEWAPLALQNKLLPRISWQMAAEIYQLKEKDALMRKLATEDQFGAHGLRLSLTALSGYAQLLAMTSDLNEKQASYVDKLVQVSDDLSETLTFLYYLIGSREEDVTLQSLVQHILTSSTFIVEQANIQLDFELAEGVGKSQCLVHGNLTMLTKSVVALVQNAVKHSPEYGRIRLSAAIIESQSVFRVQYEGEPLAAEDAGIIFDAHEQRPYKSAQDTSRPSGSLGLTIAKLVTDQMGGKVWLESQSGSGTSFCISFPVKSGEIS